ncbi:MAG: endonuclease/exonuclease/phosphatase family protein [Planctomycetaceae bacterium]|nr:endonuclease/exonuclease/phosphatase family protein [Planctomycetaceae bacterium]
MAKNQKQRAPYLRKLFYLLATLMTGSGAGGWAFPDLPVLGPAVKSVIQTFLADHGVVLPNVAGSPGATGSYPPATTGVVPTIGGAVSLVSSNQPNAPHAGAPQSETILIGSFNIQVFGTSKLQKQGIPEILVAVVRRFDVLAIQEIRTQDDQFLNKFVQMVNAEGARYAYVIGPRLGRSNSTEQYAFLYDTTRIEVRPASVTTLYDPNDLLHREPFVAQFRVVGVPPAQAFSFWLMDVHTDPDEVATELDVLADAFRVMQQQGEDDVILLGDLNADEHHLRGLGQLPGIKYAIAGVTTNTRGNKAYDNLLFDSRTTVEYTGQSGVWNLMTSFGLTQGQALEVSDHFPVGGLFSIYEGGGARIAAGPMQPR